MNESEKKLRILFVCDQNRLRSPTAEKIFSAEPRLEAKSAGIAKDATVAVSRELLEWADIVFVMEKRQRNIIHKRFREIYENKRIICLYILDQFEFMDPFLIQLLKRRVAPHLLQIVNCGLRIDKPQATSISQPAMVLFQTADGIAMDCNLARTRRSDSGGASWNADDCTRAWTILQAAAIDLP